MKTCLFCGSPSGRCKFCIDCERQKHQASAVVSQNTKKLIELLQSKWITTAGFEKFLVYTENIKKSCKILMQYKSADEIRNLIVVNHVK